MNLKPYDLTLDWNVLMLKKNVSKKNRLWSDVIYLQNVNDAYK